jgi:predicted kinase
MKVALSNRFLEDVRRLQESLGPLPKPVEPPVFIALSGLPGTGKSYFSRKLAAKLPLVILESDALRKVLFPKPTYDWRESARLFRACYFLIEELLQDGISLILDATNLSERYRKELYKIAQRTNAKFILVKMEAPPGIVRRRLEDRKRDLLSHSDADWEVYQAMKLRADGIRREHYIVNTTRPIAPVINKIVREVKKERNHYGN